jgi:Rrf2 family protein
MPQPKGDWVMLLTRKAWYGLIAVKHLAEQPPQNSFSAKDLANSYGFPQEALAKILQGLARAGLLLSHHGIKGGYTLVRDPDQISVLDVIKASEEAPGDATENTGGTWNPYRATTNCTWSAKSLRMRWVTIADIKEQACIPTERYDARRG